MIKKHVKFENRLFTELRHEIFWPPFIFILLALILSLLFPEQFNSAIDKANTWVLDNIGWLFSYSALFLFLLCIGIIISPMGKIKLGGEKAQPLFSRWKWFAIILCTTIATGILFWGTAEPIFHHLYPPQSYNIKPGSNTAAVFSLSSLFLHWSFTPYAIYTVPSLIFALAFYNASSSFSLKGMLRPLFPDRYVNMGGNFLDMLCLYALVLGMAASLGSGILLIGGGIAAYLWDGGFTLLLIVTLVIVGSFIISAASGLFRGIKYLSMINLVIFVVLLIYVAVFAPWQYLLALVPEAAADYVSSFFAKSTFTGNETGDPWPKQWTVFNWANWMAWAPITALFLGKLGRGRTVREFMIFSWVLPSVFAIVWMSLFGGSILFFDKSGIMSDLITTEGPNAMIYALFDQFPFTQLIIPFFIFAVFISYVTAADSNTEAISGLCTKNYFASSASPLLSAKLIWGVLIGAVSLIMITYSGIDGIKTLSNLGGVPSLLLLILISFNAVYLLYRSFIK